MRAMLTIFHYELLMQLKSVRFKATCLLAGLIVFGLYTDSLQIHDLLPPNRTILNFEAFPFYIILAAFTGIFAIGRVRASGMHAILMAKPFPTYALLLGQMMAALIAYLIPVLMVTYGPCLALEWQLEIEFPYIQLLHVIMFFMIPLGCSVLAITIWVRICFKNNLIAIIILALIFAGCVIFSEVFLSARGMQTSMGGQEAQAHRFIPLVSYFCKTYWNGQMITIEMPQVSFTRAVDWINLGSTMLYCNIFLMLGVYHLRRTEPQRKVLGAYGRRWYHAPTFMRMACDLKIDPHMNWRHHLALLAMMAVIGARVGWPIYEAARTQTAGGVIDKDDPYQESRIPEEKILKIRVYDERQTMLPKSYVSEMTFSVDGDTSGTVAVMPMYFRYNYSVQSIQIDGRRIPFIKRPTIIFIEGNQFKPYADGQRHKIHIDSLRDSTELYNDNSNQLDFFLSRGHFFAESKRTGINNNGEPFSTFASAVEKPWAIELEILRPARHEYLNGPVQPITHAEGDMIRYTFAVPAEKHSSQTSICFAPYGGYVFLEPANKRFNLRLAVPQKYEEMTRGLIELAEPALEDFYTLHRLAPKEQITIIAPDDMNPNPYAFREVRRYHYIYRYRGRLWDFEKQNMTRYLNDIESILLKRILMACGGIPLRAWDLERFVSRNISRGLNHRFDLSRNYEPPDHQPDDARLSDNEINKYDNRTRRECLQIRPNWPVFQMLYLIMGHEKWQAMMERLRAKPLPQGMTADALQPEAEAAMGEPLGWFFDYWLRDGKGLPSYRVESAVAKTVVGDDQTTYEVKVVVRNLGTGRMPAPVRLTTTKTPIDGKIWIGAGEAATWTVTSKNLPQSVSVDPDGWIMAKPYWNVKNSIWVRNATMNVKVE